MKTSINLEVFLRVFYQKKHVNALINHLFSAGNAFGKDYEKN